MPLTSAQLISLKHGFAHFRHQQEHRKRDIDYRSDQQRSPRRCVSMKDWDWYRTECLAPEDTALVDHVLREEGDMSKLSAHEVKRMELWISLDPRTPDWNTSPSVSPSDPHPPRFLNPSQPETPPQPRRTLSDIGEARLSESPPHIPACPFAARDTALLVANEYHRNAYQFELDSTERLTDKLAEAAHQLKAAFSNQDDRRIRAIGTYFKAASLQLSSRIQASRPQSR
ncbi:hypothetical protein P7C70_g7945, partial [Phenoliferia sp. Uapishka_3]